jgi:hypothetical protein
MYKIYRSKYMVGDKDAVFCLESGGSGDAIMQLLLKTEHYFLCECMDGDGVETLVDVAGVELDFYPSDSWGTIHECIVEESEEKVDAHYYDEDLVDFYAKNATKPCDDEIILDNFPFPEEDIIKYNLPVDRSGRDGAFWIFCFVIASIIIGVTL